ncbi:MAG: hypothetical protein KA586_03745 [Candidatus Promineofilum sp.]|nr:hypothetical protein [Promineifilum sp.]
MLVTNNVRRFNSGLNRLLGRDWPWIAAVLAVAFIAVWPAMSEPGLVNTRGGGDSPFLLQRLHQLTAALSDGQFPVRWMPDANYGYGYPFYNFYAPLSIYVAAAFRFMGFSFVRAVHLAQLAGFVVAGLGMFYLGRRWLGSRWAGLLAAVAYTIAPFHMVNVYVRGDSLAEFWAMAFYPWVLLAAEAVLQRRSGRSVALFGLAYAALILSHNISALIFSPFLLLYWVVRWVLGATDDGQQSAADKQAYRQPKQSGRLHLSPSLHLPLNFRRLWLIVCSLLLGLALAAWFFVPALTEQGLAQLGPVTEGYFHYINHFRGIELVQAALLFDYNPDGGVAFRLGLMQAALAIGGLSALIVAYRQRTVGRKLSAVTLLYLLLGAFISILMITPLSRPLWDHLPLLPFTQFPWRFLSVASFFLALFTGGLVKVTENQATRAAVALGGSIVLLAAGLLGLRVDHLILTDDDVTAERLAQYEWFTGNIGTTVSAEYLTPASEPRPWTSAWLNAGERNRVIAATGELTAESTGRTAGSQTWRLNGGDGGAEALFPTMYWPGWRAAIDGQPAELHAWPASGNMMLAVPAGEHVVTLELGRTPVRLVAEFVSLAAVVATAIMLIGRQGPAEDKRQTDPGLHAVETPPLPRSPAPLLAGFLRGLLFIVIAPLLLALIWRGDPDDLPRGDLTWDFAQMGYLHHTPGGVAFTDGARLYEYGYSADEIKAGNTLTVTLSLVPGDARTATLALVTPASARPTPARAADPPEAVSQTISLDGETAVFMLPIPANAPAGLYVPRLILAGAQPMMSSGTARGDLFLRPIRVTATAGRPPIADPSGVDIDVQVLETAARAAGTLDGRFAWWTSRPLGGRYLVSWRAQNGDGAVLSQLDTQPGYGFNPTDGWATAKWIPDWLALPLPDALTGPPPYPLVMILYDATTGEQRLLRRVGELVDASGRPAYQPVVPVFAPPSHIAALATVFGEGGREFIQLLGYEIEQSADSVIVTLYWRAAEDIPADFRRFVHLSDAAGAVAAQVDGHPIGNSYPTGQWIAGEVVADRLTLDMSAVPSGDYRVATGFYRPVEGLPRLDASDPDGPLPDGRALLPGNIIVP